MEFVSSSWDDSYIETIVTILNKSAVHVDIREQDMQELNEHGATKRLVTAVRAMMMFDQQILQKKRINDKVISSVKKELRSGLEFVNICKSKQLSPRYLWKALMKKKGYTNKRVETLAKYSNDV